MNFRWVLGVVSVCLMALPGCGASKEKVSLAYSGDDARNTADALEAAITDAGQSPNCRDRKFCKYKFNDVAVVHYKLLKRDPVLVLEISGDDMDDSDRFKLEQDMTKEAQEIWSKASSSALEKEENAKTAKADKEKEEADREAERHKVDTAAALERERLATEERIAGKKLRTEAEKEATRKKAALIKSMKVSDTVTHEAKPNRGAGLRVETPEGAFCTVISDQTQAMQELEIPFQVDTDPGIFYAVDCTMANGAKWRKKLQAKDRKVTVVNLAQGE